MKILYVSFQLFFLIAIIPCFAQKGNILWQDVDESALNSLEKSNKVLPIAKYRLLSVNLNALRSILNDAPYQSSKEAQTRSVRLSLPMPDGTMQEFEIMNAPVIHPDLAKKFPQIQTYIGKGIQDETATVRLDLTPQGFHAQIISTTNGTVLIDPYDNYYISFYKQSSQPRGENWGCESKAGLYEPKHEKSLLIAGDCRLRRYRLAVACTGEYAQANGGTVMSAMSAIVTTMNRVNGIYERELAITMQLVGNNDQLIYLDGTTDPYTDGDAGALNNENQTNCDAIIGNANYDIGHIFAVGGAGLAGVGVVCNAGNKARGATGVSPTDGDRFAVDYAVHEIGHQFGGTHTQNNNCERSASTAFEPGSASTIMGYAGICPPNVQNTSNDYFHTISIRQISAYVNGGGGCATFPAYSNDAPTANAGADFTIPIGTPFQLTASGSDINANPISFCWEQMDLTTDTLPPSANFITGPTFRSFSPLRSSSRYFPNLADLTAGRATPWEVLSSVTRNLNFTLVVRDNRVGGGCTMEDNMLVKVDNSAGPFTVTFPSTEECLFSGSTVTIAWNVAGTNTGVVNCSKVDILLSTDGGLTYPTVLADDVANNGSAMVTLPEIRSSKARIMIMCSNNIFFDISDKNFSIDCPEMLIVTDNPASGIYKAKSILETSGTVVVASGATAQFLAGEEILLKPGFHARRGSNFIAKIQVCNPCNIGTSLLAGNEEEYYMGSETVLSRTTDSKNIAMLSTLPRIFPNPFTASFTLEFEVFTPSETFIRLIDTNGKVVKEIRRSDTTEKGIYKAEIDGISLPSGVYYGLIESAGLVRYVKMVKIGR